MLALSCALTVFGVVVDVFQYEYKGFLGTCFAPLGVAPTKPVSLLSLGTGLPYSSTAPDSFGIRFFQACYLMFVLAIPLLHAAVMMVLWLVPLSLRAQQLCFHIADMCDAWSSLGVFMVSVIAALMQLHQLTMFILGDFCHDINMLIAAHFNDFTSGDNWCLDVGGSILPGFWILVAAYLFSVAVTVTFMRTIVLALRVRGGECLV